MGTSIVEAEWLALPMLGGNRDAQNALASHGVAACAPIGKEAARTVPGSLVKRNGVGVVFASECCLKRGKLHTFGFLGVLFCFGNLSDHAGVHRLYPLFVCRRLNSDRCRTISGTTSL